MDTKEQFPANNKQTEEAYVDSSSAYRVDTESQEHALERMVSAARSVY